jgi:hypothetical protein
MESTSTSPFRSTSCDNVKVDLNVLARTFPAFDSTALHLAWQCLRAIAPERPRCDVTDRDAALIRRDRSARTFRVTNGAWPALSDPTTAAAEHSAREW